MATSVTGKAAQRAQQWRERIARQASSGMSVAAFCRQEGMSVPTFYEWRRRLRQPDDRAGAGRATPPLFLDLGAVPAAEAASLAPGGMLSIRLELPGGVALTITRA